MVTPRKLPAKPRRIVIKVGSQLLVDNGGLRQAFMRKLAKQIHELQEHGIECILVSSGAIGCGKQYLSLSSHLLTLPEKQTAAAVGQGRLMHVYEKIFARFDILTAQLLLTREDLQERQRYLNASHTLNCILKHKILPIINENDTVSVDEIKFGDNDILASLIAGAIQADALIILSSIDGLLDKNTNRVSIADLNDKNIWSLVRADKTTLGTGGMQSKLTAAKTLAEMGKFTVVANGNLPNVLLKIIQQQDVGTLFLPIPQNTSSKKHWLATVAKAKGEVAIDAGAKKALLEKGTSLLASGILEVISPFKKGDLVLITCNKELVAKGLVNYSAEEVKKICGKKTQAIAAILGYKTYDEVIHRDNLALFK